MTPRALIFDVDGTLAETEEAHRLAFNRAFDEAAMTWCWSKDDYRRLLRTTGGKERMRAHRTAIDADGPSDERIAQLHRRKTAIYNEIVTSGGIALRPGVENLIAAARGAGLRIAVATTTNRPNVDALCHACWTAPASDVFDVIAAGDEVASKKPAPDVFLLALDRLQLGPEHCIAFEDSRNGLLSAKAAGLTVIVTPSAYTNDEDFSGADCLLPDLTPPNLPKPLRFIRT